jgi:hypothetical protein
MWRRKSIKVTVNNLNMILNHIRDTFERSDAPKYLKKKLAKLHPIFEIVNAPKWQLYGQAYLVGQYAKKCAVKKRLKLKIHTHPSVYIDDNYFFCILQINKGAMHVVSYRGLRYLVAHELAHLLQIVVDEEVDGQFSYSTALDHDSRWQNITKWMGGTGSEIIPFKEIWV